MAAYRTAGTRPPFRSAEARNADVFTLLVEVLDVLALLPLGHPLEKHIPMRPPGALFWCALRPPTAARPGTCSASSPLPFVRHSIMIDQRDPITGIG